MEQIKLHIHIVCEWNSISSQWLLCLGMCCAILLQTRNKKKEKKTINTSFQWNGIEQTQSNWREKTHGKSEMSAECGKEKKNCKNDCAVCVCSVHTLHV